MLSWSDTSDLVLDSSKPLPVGLSVRHANSLQLVRVDRESSNNINKVVKIELIQNECRVQLVGC